MVALATVALMTAGVVALVSFQRNTGRRYPSTHAGAPKVERSPTALHLSRNASLAAHTVAVKFIQTAVLRTHVASSWALAAPALRRGFTPRRWATGNIPVVPYPADSPQHAPWRVIYAYPGRVLLQVALLPRHDQTAVQRGQVFMIELVPGARREDGRRGWLVSSWFPRGGTPSLGSDTRAAARGRAASGAGGIGAGWLFLPLAVLGLVVLLPVGLGVREWRRGVRARKAYFSDSDPF